LEAQREQPKHGFKNYGTNIMFLKEAINSFLCKKDSLNIFNWEIKEDTKTILGYSCQLAVVTLEEGLMKLGYCGTPDAGHGNLVIYQA
jgi:GLPGLI family protein